MTLLNMAATYQSLLLFLLWWWLHSSGCYCNCGFHLLLMMCLCFKPLETKWIQLLIHGHLNNIPLTPQSIIKTKQNEVLKKRANNLCHLKFTWQGLFLNWYTHTHTELAFYPVIFSFWIFHSRKKQFLRPMMRQLMAYHIR